MRGSVLLLRGIVLALLMCSVYPSFAQDSTSTVKKNWPKGLDLTADIRLRVEHDWDSMKSDSSMRSDRTRFRFRLRFGASYQYKWASFGFRMRSGNLNDQQGPHVTLGGGSGEFSLIQIGLEKAYLQAHHKWLKVWFGKNTFPFFKQNELFWNDNTYPDGIAVSTKHDFDGKLVSGLDLNAGHFVVSSNGKFLDTDRYFQGVQVVGRFWDDRIRVHPSFYYFNALQNIPDGKGTYNVEYSILHTGVEVKARTKHPTVSVGAENFINLAELNRNDSIPTGFHDQKLGAVASLKVGSLKRKHGWTVQLYYAYLQKYAVVDYFQQNDWARWDYSFANATGSRLTNSQGVELRIGYSPLKNLTVILRTYWLQRIKREGVALEDGYRARLDINFGF